MTMRTGLLSALFLALATALLGLGLAGCEDEAGQDCELGTECPGGGCMDGVCVTICDDPCADRDDLTCVIDMTDAQMCVDTDRVNIDRNFVPVSGSPGGTTTETDTGSSEGTDAGVDLTTG